MTARAVDGREATCEWKVSSSVMFLILDIVNIKHKHFNAPSQVYAESLWLTGLFLITYGASDDATLLSCQASADISVCINMC